MATASDRGRDPAERGIMRLFYRDWHPTRLGRIVNRVMALRASAGLTPASRQTLEVRGRRSGKVRSNPVVVTTAEGQRYVVSMLGPQSAWVANVAADDGRAVLVHGRREPVRLVLIPPAERALILREYVRAAESGRRHIPLSPDAGLAEFGAIADRYPVYRVDQR
jgi:deazaflavin-dependent oxidoreductase (nitroreductase family)